MIDDSVPTHYTQMGRHQLAKAWDYEFGHWPLEGVPMRLLYSKDASASYEEDRFHVFCLDNGKFVTVHESGCSCYEPSEADIEYHRSKEKALKTAKEWEKRVRDSSYSPNPEETCGCPKCEKKP